MKLFDDLNIRSVESPPQNRGEFSYLNETGIPQAEPIRTFFEQAFANFTGNKNELRGRFRSKRNEAHLGAAFELLIHEMMVRRGLNPSAPTLSDGGKPDLRITISDSSTSIVEARMMQPSQNVHFKLAIDIIDSLRAPFVQWHVWIDRELTQQFSPNSLRATISTLAKSRPAELFPEKFDRKGPHAVFEAGQSRLCVYGIYSPQEPDGALSWHESDAEFTSTDDIKKTIKRKSRAYSLSEPYVLALCSAKAYASSGDFSEAVFRTSPGAGNQDLRGVWAKGDCSSVSAILACYEFKPSSLKNAKVHLLVNRNAKYPLLENPFGCATLDSGSKHPQELPTPLQEVLSMPAEWLTA